MEVPVFGIKNDADTRKALRLFKERRVRVHFVDLMQRAASPGELRRFAQKLGAATLVNARARRYEALGLGAAHLTDELWLATFGGKTAHPVPAAGTLATALDRRSGRERVA